MTRKQTRRVIISTSTTVAQAASPCLGLVQLPWGKPVVFVGPLAKRQRHLLRKRRRRQQLILGQLETP